MKKKRKHKKILDDYETSKSKHLEKLATQMLQKDQHNQKLKGKIIDPGFLDKF